MGEENNNGNERKRNKGEVKGIHKRCAWPRCRSSSNNEIGGEKENERRNEDEGNFIENET